MRKHFPETLAETNPLPLFITLMNISKEPRDTLFISTDNLFGLNVDADKISSRAWVVVGLFFGFFNTVASISRR